MEMDWKGAANHWLRLFVVNNLQTYIIICSQITSFLHLFTAPAWAESHIRELLSEKEKKRLESLVVEVVRGGLKMETRLYAMERYLNKDIPDTEQRQGPRDLCGEVIGL